LLQRIYPSLRTARFHFQNVAHSDQFITTHPHRILKLFISFDMTRAIQLIVFNSPLFPAHWALFNPHSSSQNCGTLVHAVGDAKDGFDTSFERNYNIGATTLQYQSLQLATISDEFVKDSQGDGKRSQESTARDRLEQVVLSIPAPRGRLNSSSSE
jgi:hypothetical protein